MIVKVLIPPFRPFKIRTRKNCSMAVFLLRLEMHKKFKHVMKRIRGMQGKDLPKGYFSTRKREIRINGMQSCERDYIMKNNEYSIGILKPTKEDVDAMAIEEMGK